MPKASQMLSEQPKTAAEILVEQEKKDHDKKNYKKSPEKKDETGSDEVRYKQYVIDRTERGIKPLGFRDWYQAVQKY